jgi:hypothetical protein
MTIPLIMMFCIGEHRGRIILVFESTPWFRD